MIEGDELRVSIEACASGMEALWLDLVNAFINVIRREGKLEEN